MSIRTLSILSVLVVAASSQAGLTVYQGADASNSTDARPTADAAAASFDAATGSTGAYDFESAPVGSFSSLSLAAGVTLTGTDINGFNQTVRNSPMNMPDGLFGYNTTAGGSNFASFFGATMTLTFDTPASAFGAYFTGNQLDGDNVTAYFVGGGSETVHLTLLDGGVEFLGFTSTEGISSVVMDMTYDIVGVDDIRTAEAVPEPASMVALGLGVVAAIRRRRQS
jgi:hypothetical protein